MLTNDFLGRKAGRLGFGAMRLPLKPNKTVDEKETARMTEYALSHGVNYIDTAWPYHGGHSETVMGEILSAYDRSSFMLADKFPGHQWLPEYHPEEIFEEQLRRCKTDYFDCYLLHNVCEYSYDTYADERWDIIGYFVKQKELGRIRHLGFSTHSAPEHLKKVLALLKGKAEFCQIQLNYYDWTMQGAREKYEMLSEAGLPVIVMEPVRGGMLAKLPPEQAAALRALRPEESQAGWSFRFLQDLPGCRVILSGMSDFAQMKENIEIFGEEKPLRENELSALLSVGDALSRDRVPCTGCRYCTEGCPQGLDIPALLKTYNDLKCGGGGFTARMLLESLPKDKRPEACLKCGKCSRICPQGIDIPAVLAETVQLQASLPSWQSVCEERAAQAEALKKQSRNK